MLEESFDEFKECCVLCIMIHAGLETILVLTHCRHQDGEGSGRTLYHDYRGEGNIPAERSPSLNWGFA